MGDLKNMLNEPSVDLGLLWIEIHHNGKKQFLKI